MQDPVFVIMAAGMGSRFGGLKQITPVDDAGHKIIDFSLYDAYRAGFRKAVFIIKHEIEDDFRRAVGERMERIFDVRYVYQELDAVPAGTEVPAGRKKPWGTAHAVACAAGAIDGPFAVLNADDWYGPTAIDAIYRFLREDRAPDEYAMVGYRLANTLTENGSVARGICRIRDGYLTDVTECTRIERDGADAFNTEDDGTRTPLKGDATVSMNLWGFQTSLLEELHARLPAFFERTQRTDPLGGEFYLPEVVGALIREHRATVRVLPTAEKWHGVTYAADLADVRASLTAMEQDGTYPAKLWPDE